MIDLTAHAEAIRDAMHIRHWETAKEQDERILTAVRALAEDAARAAIEAAAARISPVWFSTDYNWQETKNAIRNLSPADIVESK